jgi:hypothetical protein
MPKPKTPPRTGNGALNIARVLQPVEFSISFARASNGQRSGKGAVTGDPAAMREAFRSGRAELTLDDGAKLNVSIVAHSEGSQTAYFQLD